MDPCSIRAEPLLPARVSPPNPIVGAKQSGGIEWKQMIDISDCFARKSGESQAFG